ncbi:hypothetical protein [Bizionia argentinensis]|nr:hypothetical protein [Bizionia argentinensis]
MAKYLFLLLTFTLISCNNKSTQNGVIKTEKSEIETLIDSAAAKMINDSLINSTSIGIYFDGKEYISHYGELEKRVGNTPSNKTIYEIGF